METGLMGFPLSGKTTIFNAVTGSNADTSSYAGGNKFNLAEVKVPDERLAVLAGVFQPKKVTHATILVKEISVEVTEKGVLSPAAVAQLRNCEALVIVIRAFTDPALHDPSGPSDPLSDFTRLLDSLIWSDYEVAERRLERLAKEGKRATREGLLLQGISEKLGAGQLIGVAAFDKQDEKLLSGFCFLTAKPLIVCASTGEQALPTGPLIERARLLGIPAMEIRGDLEMEIARLPADEQAAFLQDIGVEEPAVKRFVKTIYKHLNLISFLTAGEDEVRAWSVMRDTPASQAAGKIHSDLEKGFIRAEVVPWRELADAAGFQEAKKRGLSRLEGKDYPVKDGDVLTIRFNI